MHANLKLMIGLLLIVSIGLSINLMSKISLKPHTCVNSSYLNNSLAD